MKDKYFKHCFVPFGLFQPIRFYRIGTILQKGMVISMASQKLTFEDFITTVDGEYRGFVEDMQGFLIESGCKIAVKEAKSGYLVSYALNNKTILNYVFRKKGLIIRIYANHLNDYMGLLDSFPDSMVETIKVAPVCKRLINPEDCNSKCSKGYDFLLHGERLQKCRNNAFMFLVCHESIPYIMKFLEKEVEASLEDRDN